MSVGSRRLRRLIWRLAGRIGLPVVAQTDRRATVLIAFCHQARLVHLDGHLRNLARCRFVDRILVSNQSAFDSLRDRTSLHDTRLSWTDRFGVAGAGHRWHLARSVSPDYLIVIDDDVLLRPSQLATLFEKLVAEPDRPHGISGLVAGRTGEWQFVDRANQVVDYLCEVYAVTRSHLERYGQVEKAIGAVAPLGPSIASHLDFAVISGTGPSRPRIHDLGHILRCETFNKPDAALHQQTGFWTDLDRYAKARERVGAISQTAIEASGVEAGVATSPSS